MTMDEIKGPINRLGPAPWAECTDAEKIDRLKLELDGWRRACAELRGRVDLLESHQHAPDGKVMIDLQQADRVHRMNSCVGSFNTLA
jgi:hypothetical protein